MKKKQVKTHKLAQRSASELFELVRPQLRLPRVTSLHDYLVAETALRAEYFEWLANLLLRHFPTRRGQKLGGQIRSAQKRIEALQTLAAITEAEGKILRVGATRNLNKLIAKHTGFSLSKVINARKRARTTLSSKVVR